MWQGEWYLTHRTAGGMDYETGWVHNMANTKESEGSKDGYEKKSKLDEQSGQFSLHQGTHQLKESKHGTQ